MSAVGSVGGPFDGCLHRRTHKKTIAKVLAVDLLTLHL